MLLEDDMHIYQGKFVCSYHMFEFDSFKFKIIMRLSFIYIKFLISLNRS